MKLILENWQKFLSEQTTILPQNKIGRVIYDPEGLGGTPNGADVFLEAPYGWVHNEEQTIVSNKFSEKFHTVGKHVPRRRFFGTPVAFFRRKEFKKIQREANEMLANELSKSKTVTIN